MGKKKLSPDLNLRPMLERARTAYLCVPVENRTKTFNRLRHDKCAQA